MLSRLILLGLLIVIISSCAPLWKITHCELMEPNDIATQPNCRYTTTDPKRIIYLPYENCI